MRSIESHYEASSVYLSSAVRSAVWVVSMDKKQDNEKRLQEFHMKAHCRNLHINW